MVRKHWNHNFKTNFNICVYYLHSSHQKLVQENNGKNL